MDKKCNIQIVVDIYIVKVENSVTSKTMLANVTNNESTWFC